MNTMVLNDGGWNEMKPRNIQSVSHRISRPHAHHQPQVSRDFVRISASSMAFRALLCPFLVCMFSVVFASGQASQPGTGKSSRSGSAAPTNAPPDASKYVGAETCKTCHEDIYNAWEKTPHWKTTLNKSGGPSKQGCEGCHGPGADHVAGGGDKTKIYVFKEHSRQETSARCLACHGDGHEQSHFAQSSHASSEVGCLDCHSPHHAKEKEHLLAKSQPDLCYGCHTAAKEIGRASC